MQLPDDKHLEQFIDRQLKKLPERQAPETLIGNVMASLAARAELPWYKKPWSDWPRLHQNLFLATLVSVLAAVAWFIAPVADAVSLSALSEKARVVSWIPEVLQHLFSSAGVVAKSVRYEWILAGFAACAISYAWCVAAGVAVFRVASQRRFSL